MEMNTINQKNYSNFVSEQETCHLLAIFNLHDAKLVNIVNQIAEQKVDIWYS